MKFSIKKLKSLQILDTDQEYLLKHDIPFYALWLQPFLLHIRLRHLHHCR